MPLNSELFFDHHTPNADAVAVVIIPGLFGSISNWRSFAKRFSEQFPVIVIDQRNHGRSPHSASHRYADMAEDLLELCDDHGLDQIVLCGHSMGGKTAMVFSLLYPERVAALAVLDILPKTYQDNHTSHIEALMSIDLRRLGSRSEADKALQADIPNQATRLFLLQSLTGRPGEYSWRLNLPVLADFMPSIAGFPEVELSGVEFHRRCLLVYGADSKYVDPQDFGYIEQYFKSFEAIAIANAGHWLQIDQSQRLLDSLATFVNKVKKYE